MTSFAAVAADLDQTLARVRPLLDAISDGEASQRPKPGKWSKKEILGHLLDSASNNHQRFVRAAIEKELAFPGYPQDALVELQRFNEMKWGFLTSFWFEYNFFLGKILRVLPQEVTEVRCMIGNNPVATLGWIAEDYVAHLKHHLNQIVGMMFETSYGKKV